MEKNVDLEIWWSSLPISEKERIARKGLSKAGLKEDDNLILYPGCTRWWQSLEEKRKESIYAHCVAKHGDELKEWKEGNPYGD
jgi:hypothetical protein